MVTETVAEGWAPEDLWQVIAGRDVPSPIRTTGGAVVSSCLRTALCGPAPRPGAFPHTRQERETPTPDAWSEERAVLRDRPGERESRDGLCGRPTTGDSRLCSVCWQTTPSPDRLVACGCQRRPPPLPVRPPHQGDPSETGARGEQTAGWRYEQGGGPRHCPADHVRSQMMVAATVTVPR